MVLFYHDDNMIKTGQGPAGGPKAGCRGHTESSNGELPGKMHHSIRYSFNPDLDNVSAGSSIRVLRESNVRAL